MWDLIYLASICAAGLVVLLIFARQPSPEMLLKRAERGLGAGKTEAAKTLYARVLARSARAREETVALASRRLGEIALGKNDRAAAFEHFKRAKAGGQDLAPPAALALAEGYANAGASSKEAEEAYVACVTMPASTGPQLQTVLKAIEDRCRVHEDGKPDPRHKAAELSRKVIAANDGIEWAHYDLGLSLVLDGHHEQAVAPLERARKLSPGRALTSYWLCECELERAGGEFQHACALLDEFLKKSPAGKDDKHAAKICGRIASRFIEMVSGFDTDEPCIAGERRSFVERAVHYLEIALQRTPDDGAHAFSLGRSLLLIGETRRAVTAFEQALTTRPGDKHYAYQLGIAREQAGMNAEAVAAYEQAIASDVKFGDAHARLGCLQARLGAFASAEPRLKAALTLRSKDPLLLATLAHVLHARGKHRESVTLVDSWPAGLVSPSTYPEAAIDIGRSYLRRDRHDAAIGWLTGARSNATAEYYLGCALALAGQLEQAERCFTGIVDGGAGWALPAIVQRGHVRLARGDVDGAQRDYGLAIERYPGDVHAMFALASLLLEREDIDTAIQWLERVLTADPGYYQARFAMGVAHERAKRSEDALQYYLTVPAEAQCARDAALRAAVLRCRHGQYTEALEGLDECAKQGDVNDTLLFYRGLASAQTGALDAAYREWNRLATRRPENQRLALNLARLQYLLGARHLADGHITSALAAWDRYLEVYPTDDRTARDTAELHFQIAAMNWRRSDLPDRLSTAAEHLQVAISRDAQRLEYRFFDALCAMCQGDVDRSVVGLKALMTTGFAPPRVQYHLALALQRQGQEGEAQRLLECVQTTDTGIYGRAATVAVANHRIQQAAVDAALALFDHVNDAAYAAADPGGPQPSAQ